MREAFRLAEGPASGQRAMDLQDGLEAWRRKYGQSPSLAFCSVIPSCSRRIAALARQGGALLNMVCTSAVETKGGRRVRGRTHYPDDFQRFQRTISGYNRTARLPANSPEITREADRELLTFRTRCGPYLRVYALVSPCAQTHAERGRLQEYSEQPTMQSSRLCTAARFAVVCPQRLIAVAR